MKLTVDSTEPLEDVLRVLGALYGVELVIGTERTDMRYETGPGQSGRTTKRSRTRRSPVTRARGERSRAQRTTATATGNSSRSAGRASNAEVRAWAQRSGIRVSDRGRIPASVMDAYAQAHSN